MSYPLERHIVIKRKSLLTEFNHNLFQLEPYQREPIPNRPVTLSMAVWLRRTEPILEEVAWTATVKPSEAAEWDDYSQGS